MPEQNRRSVLKLLGSLGAAATIPTITSAEESEDRYIIDAGDELSEWDKREASQSDLEVIHELEHVGYFIVRGSESKAEALGADYHPDIKLEFNQEPNVPDELQQEVDSEDIPSPEEARKRLKKATEAAKDEHNGETTEVEPDGHNGPASNLPFPDEYAWDVDLLNLEDAHSINRGTKSNGDKVRVGIIDDGIYDHSHLDVDAGASTDLTGDGESPLHPNEQHYHGTHVSGIVAAEDGAGTGVGVAPEAELVSLRYFSTAEGNFFGNFVAAINAAIATDCDVINASLGFTEDQPESRTYLQDYIKERISELADIADSFGIVWVASAGNSGNNANDLVPGAAKAEKVLSVSSTGPTGMVRPDGNGGEIRGDPIKDSTTPANYTTHGNEYVDVSAPGGSWDVYQDVPELSTDVLRNYVAPDAVLSTFPPDTFGSSVFTEFILGLYGFGSPLPGYIMYGTPVFAGEPILASSHQPYLLPYTINDSGRPYYIYQDTSNSTLEFRKEGPDAVSSELALIVNFDVPDDVYGSLQGTSMSAPQVAGLAALLSAENPDWTPHEIRRVIKATAREDVGKSTYHGHGLIDPAAALEVDDPADVRGQLGNPDEDDDRGRNETGGGSPRNSSGRDSDDGDENSSRGRGDGDDDDSSRGRGDDEEDDSSRGRGRD